MAFTQRGSRGSASRITTSSNARLTSLSDSVMYRIADYLSLPSLSLYATINRASRTLFTLDFGLICTPPSVIPASMAAPPSSSSFPVSITITLLPLSLRALHYGRYYAARRTLDTPGCLLPCIADRAVPATVTILERMLTCMPSVDHISLHRCCGLNNGTATRILSVSTLPIVNLSLRWCMFLSCDTALAAVAPGRLAAIRQLDLVGNSPVKDHSLQLLTTCAPYLTELRLELAHTLTGTDETLRGLLARCTQLRHLELRGKGVNETAWLSVLHLMVSLQTLILWAAPPTDRTCAAVARHCTQLIECTLFGAQLTNIGISALASLPRLAKCWLMYTRGLRDDDLHNFKHSLPSCTLTYLAAPIIEPQLGSSDLPPRPLALFPSRSM